MTEQGLRTPSFQAVKWLFGIIDYLMPKMAYASHLELSDARKTRPLGLAMRTSRSAKAAAPELEHVATRHDAERSPTRFGLWRRRQGIH